MAFFAYGSTVPFYTHETLVLKIRQQGVVVYFQIGNFWIVSIIDVMIENTLLVSYSGLRDFNHRTFCSK